MDQYNNNQFGVFGNPQHGQYADIEAVAHDLPALQTLYLVEQSKIARIEAEAEQRLANRPPVDLKDHNAVRADKDRYFAILGWQLNHLFMPQNRRQIILQKMKSLGGLADAPIPHRLKSLANLTGIQDPATRQIILQKLDAIINQPPPTMMAPPPAPFVTVGDKILLGQGSNDTPSNRTRAYHIVKGLRADGFLNSDDIVTIHDVVDAFSFLSKNAPKPEMIVRDGNKVDVWGKQTPLSKVEDKTPQAIAAPDRGFPDWVKITDCNPDEGGHHRAIVVAQAVKDAGLWQQDQEIWIHDPYAVHLIFERTKTVKVLKITDEPDGIHVRARIPSGTIAPAHDTFERAQSRRESSEAVEEKTNNRIAESDKRLSRFRDKVTSESPFFKRQPAEESTSMPAELNTGS